MDYTWEEELLSEILTQPAPSAHLSASLYVQRGQRVRLDLLQPPRKCGRV